MKDIFVAILALGLLSWASAAGAQLAEAEAKGQEPEGTWSQAAPPEEEEGTKVRGFIGGLLGVGFGVNGQIDSGRKAHVDTSLLFALRGGLLVGKEHRDMITFEVAPVTNKLDWRLSPTATFFASYGRLVPLRDRKDWSWLWRVGLGVGGGLDYRFLVGAQLDVLTFNYKMNEKIWIDFGIPTVRFHIETANQARYNVQFVFPFGITFAL